MSGLTAVQTRHWAVRSFTGWGLVRSALYVGYAVVFVQQEDAVGFPFDRERLFLWIGALLAISCLGRPWRRATSAIADWVPFLAVLWAYEISRGLADDIGLPLQVQAQLDVEKFLFFGHVPTVVLQEHLIGHSVGWWELGLAIVYASHFVIPFAVPAALWLRDRRLWFRYVLRYILITTAGLITYCILPSAPPWMASERGLLPAVGRPIGRGWGKIHFTAAAELIDAGRIALNPVAAIPSLHAAFSLLVVATVWPHIRRRWVRYALLAYPLAMAFTLVIGAEHYVVDILVGWLYVWIAFVLARKIERRWDARRERRAGTATDAPAVADV